MLGDCKSAVVFHWSGDQLMVDRSSRCMSVALCNNYTTVCQDKYVNMAHCDATHGNQAFKLLPAMGTSGTATKLQSTMFVADSRDALQCLTACS